MKAERLVRWILLGGLFAALFGIKVDLIHRFGTDLAFMDQWAREGDMVIAPAREGVLRVWALLVPHSEHRIVPTLALNLGLTQWSGQWDVRVACVVNAVIHTAIMVLFAGYVFRAYSRGAALATAWLQLAMALTALDWENTLISFQSQFYFLIGFSLVAIWGLLDPRGWVALRWWIGLLAGALATISMGSGLVCFAPVAAVVALRLFEASKGSSSGARQALRAAQSGKAAATLAIALAAIALAWLNRGLAPWDLPLQAKSLGDFLRYFLHCLAWPSLRWAALAALVWLPWAYFAIREFGRYSLRQELLLGAGLWVLLQIAAVAFYRGVDGGYPSSRYTDIFQIGLLLNLLAWIEVERDLPFSPRLHWTSRAGWLQPRTASLVLWLVIFLIGALPNALETWQNLLPQHYRPQPRLRRKRRMVRSDGRRHPPASAAPYPVSRRRVVQAHRRSPRHARGFARQREFGPVRVVTLVGGSAFLLRRAVAAGGRNPGTFGRQRVDLAPN